MKSSLITAALATIATSAALLAVPAQAAVGSGAAATVTCGSPLGTVFSAGDAADCQEHSFVLGVQGGGTYSLFLFNGGGSGSSAVEFHTYSVTQGFAGLAAPRLTQAATFTSAVPEPATYAFMLSGLLVLGLLAQRRRAAAPTR